MATRTGTMTTRTARTGTTHTSTVGSPGTPITATPTTTGRASASTCISAARIGIATGTGLLTHTADHRGRSSGRGLRAAGGQEPFAVRGGRLNSRLRRGPSLEGLSGVTRPQRAGQLGTLQGVPARPAVWPPLSLRDEARMGRPREATQRAAPRPGRPDRQIAPGRVPRRGLRPAVQRGRRLEARERGLRRGVLRDQATARSRLRAGQGRLRAVHLRRLARGQHRLGVGPPRVRSGLARRKLAAAGRVEPRLSRGQAGQARGAAAPALGPARRLGAVLLQGGARAPRGGAGETELEGY